MADKNKSFEVEDIQEKIRRLQKEKDELERKNKESQLEQLRSLEENVSTLKSSTPGSFSVRGNSSRDYAERSPVDARSRSLNPNLNISELSDYQNDSREKSQFSEEESDVDEEMTPEHKRAILENRDVLVENIIADDLFSELIAKRVLTLSDVNRIKGKGGAEAKNEELLTVISKRSDRAFYIFVDALRKTLQAWLANKLDPPTPTAKSRMKRKRKSGEVRVNVDCESIVHSSQKKFKCSCQEVEELMLQMAKNAYTHIRRKDASPAAYDQFKKELEGTNKMIMESTEVTNMIKMICRHGKLTDISDGSVCFTIRCKSLAACEELWEAFASGTMLQAFHVGFVSPYLLKKCGARSIKLFMRISRFEYLTCALELAKEELNCLSKTPIKMRLRQKKMTTYSNNSIPAMSFSGLIQHTKYTLQSQPNNLMMPHSNDIYSCSVSHVPLKLESKPLASLSDNGIQNSRIPKKSHLSWHNGAEKIQTHNWRSQNQDVLSLHKENIPTMNYSVKWNTSHYNLRNRN